MSISNFLYDVKIFIQYIVMKPLIEVVNMFKMFYDGAGELDRPYFWVKFFGMSTIFLIVVGTTTKYYMPAYICAAMTFIALIRFEWISGEFRKWHVDEIKKRAKKLNEEGK